MEKSELLHWLQKEQQNWRALLDEIGRARMDQPGVSGDWSMKDMVAHLTGWNRNLVIRLDAALQGKPEPPPPWPADHETDVRAWLDRELNQY